MSTTDTDLHAPSDQLAHGHDGVHPSEKQYFVVAGILAALTAIEVGLYYTKGLSDSVLIGSLGVLAILKFVMVVMYFMHLKFDSPAFRRLFVAGMVLAIAVYCAMLGAMHFFSGGNPFITTS